MIAVALIMAAIVMGFAAGYFVGLANGRQAEREDRMRSLRAEYDALAVTLDEVTQPAPPRKPLPRFDIN